MLIDLHPWSPFALTYAINSATPLPEATSSIVLRKVSPGY